MTRAAPSKAPRLFHRQRLLLGLVDALGGEVGNLDFQKLLFLYCQEVEEAPYDFVPYRFGAFSFTSYADRRKLIDRGFLQQRERHWALTDEGRAEVERSTTGRLRRFAREMRNLDTEADYAALFAEYAVDTLPTQRDALDTIERWAHQGERVALTCYERLPQHCHRVTEALESPALTVAHL